MIYCKYGKEKGDKGINPHFCKDLVTDGVYSAESIFGQKRLFEKSLMYFEKGLMFFKQSLIFFEKGLGPP